MKRFFISYRREDSAGHAGRLFDFFSERLGGDRVFMDVDGIEPGVDFVVTLERALAGSEVVLAVIGRGWLDAADREGRRRLDDPNDFVRLELATALKMDGVRVVPVLVQDADMPRAQQLPDDLKSLARRNAFTMADARWGRDCEDLLRGLLPKGSDAGRGGEAAQGDAGANGGAAAAGRGEGKPTDDGGGRRRGARLWAALAGIVAVAGGVGWYAIGGGGGGGGGSGGGSADGGAGGGSTRVEVPHVVGNARAEAEKVLAVAGLGVGGVERRVDDSVAPGIVIDQKPASGSRVPPATKVALVLAREQAEQISAAFEPARLDFGKVFVGESGSLQAALVNEGKTALTVGTIRVIGHADAFDVGGGAPCSGTRLMTGERCAFEVRFTARGGGDREANVVFTTASGATLGVLTLAGSVRLPPQLVRRLCKQGWVWREAFDTDYVCVTPQVRAQVAADNAQRAARIDPANQAFGPATCRPGFVWRVADDFLRPEKPADLVCVTAEQRAQAAADNAARASRWQPLKPAPVKPLLQPIN